MMIHKKPVQSPTFLLYHNFYFSQTYCRNILFIYNLVFVIKEKKTYLANQSIDQCKHLIIICKTDVQHNDHFNEISVVKTLVDALKLQQKAPILLASPDYKSLKQAPLSSVFLELSPALHSD